VLGLYFPPLFKLPEEPCPPHTIISLLAQTAVCPSLPVGALVVEVAIQLSVLGLYLPPVLKFGVGVGVGVGGEAGAGSYLSPAFSCTKPPTPPHTIISLPVQTAVCEDRARGALVMLVGVQLFVPGLYLPPELKVKPLGPSPPQTTISFPVQTVL
jgi:hypothetical protein